MKKIIFFTIIASLFVSCSKENPYVDRAEIDALIAQENPEINNLSFIYENDIYFLTNFDAVAERITNTPMNSKTIVKMSFNYQKFAYLNDNEVIEIVDRNGNLLETLTQYTQVKSFDWIKGNSSLYVLNGNNITFHGSAINIPTITYPSNIPPFATKEIMAASISVSGDLAYIIQYYSFSTGTQHLVVAKKNDGLGQEIVLSQDPGDIPVYVQFSSNQQDLVVGFGELNEIFLTKFQLFENLKTYPDKSIEYSEKSLSPIYRSDLNLQIYCEQSTDDSQLRLTAINLRETAIAIKKKQRDKYSDVSLYLDWK